MDIKPEEPIMSSKISSHTQNRHSGSSFVSALAFPAAIAVEIVQRIRDRRELNQLLGMSDHELKDIGLPRHEIVRQSMQPIWWRIGG